MALDTPAEAPCNARGGLGRTARQGCGKWGWVEFGSTLVEIDRTLVVSNLVDSGSTSAVVGRSCPEFGRNLARLRTNLTGCGPGSARLWPSCDRLKPLRPDSVRSGRTLGPATCSRVGASATAHPTKASPNDPRRTHSKRGADPSDATSRRYFSTPHQIRERIAALVRMSDGALESASGVWANNFLGELPVGGGKWGIRALRNHRHMNDSHGIAYMLVDVGIGHASLRVVGSAMPCSAPSRRSVVN